MSWYIQPARLTGFCSGATMSFPSGTSPNTVWPTGISSQGRKLRRAIHWGLIPGGSTPVRMQNYLISEEISKTSGIIYQSWTHYIKDLIHHNTVSYFKGGSLNAVIFPSSAIISWSEQTSRKDARTFEKSILCHLNFLFLICNLRKPLAIKWFIYRCWS